MNVKSSTCECKKALLVNTVAARAWHSDKKSDDKLIQHNLVRLSLSLYSSTKTHGASILGLRRPFLAGCVFR